MKVYAFDVDETLYLSHGPVQWEALVALRAEGHVLGLCGNWSAVTLQVTRVAPGAVLYGAELDRNGQGELSCRDQAIRSGGGARDGWQRPLTTSVHLAR
jgi:hypothetical protein